MTLDRLEERIGGLLGLGTAVSSVLLAAGLGLWLAGQQTTAGWLLTIGLITLIATPVGRVMVSAVGFALHGDWPMVVMTLLVLASLFASVVVALRRH